MLYLVATPIGNLSDISLRALETLRLVDYVASEDTRKTGRLLKHFEISKPQIAFHEYNEKKAGSRILGLLAQGQSVSPRAGVVDHENEVPLVSEEPTNVNRSRLLILALPAESNSVMS